MEPRSPALQADSLPAEPPGNPCFLWLLENCKIHIWLILCVFWTALARHTDVCIQIYSKESACNSGDLGLIPGSGRSPGEGKGNPLQYSCLENPMDRGAWQATVHGVAKSQTRLSQLTLSLKSYCFTPIQQR